VMTWDVLAGQASWPMTNVRYLHLPQWRKLAERPENRCLIPLTEFAEFTPEKHDLGDGKPPLKGEMWFSVPDQPVFAVAGFWQANRGRRWFRHGDLRCQCAGGTDPSQSDDHHPAPGGLRYLVARELRGRSKAAAAL